MYNRTISLLLVFIVVLACHSSKVYGPTLADLKAKHYVDISLQELLESKGRYHGQFVETKGYISFGFEKQAIHYNLNIPFGDSTVKYRMYCGLWIEFNVNDPLHYSYPDALNNKFVTVKGYFDTTKNGHVGGCYQAELTDAFDLKIIDKSK